MIYLTVEYDAMENKQKRKDRLLYLAKNGMLPFDLDFFRELGFEFGEDWDGQILIEYPDKIDPEKVVELIILFEKGIKTRLYFEGQKAKMVCVGGPFNGKQYYTYLFPEKPLLFHIKRGQWAVYRVKDHNDPRAWFTGFATSKMNAKKYILKK